MAAASEDLDLLQYRRAGAHISATDGRVGALIGNSQYFITSPNQCCLFQPPQAACRLFLRADSLYGEDDPIQWPQPYNYAFCHYGAMPRPLSLGAHLIIWWEPAKSDFIRFDESEGVVLGLGRLSDARISDLQSSVSFLLTRVEEYRETIPPSSTISPLVDPLQQTMQHSLSGLRSIQTSFRQMCLGVRNVQRCWLELFAFVDWMTIYKPIMDGTVAPRAVGTAEAVEAIGVFTSEVRIAQDFYLAGLPVWLIRPRSQFAGVNILEVGPLLIPSDHIVTNEHRHKYPVIFEGPASSNVKFDRIYANSRSFLRYPDYFTASADEVASIPRSSTALRTPESSSGAVSGQSRQRTAAAQYNGARARGPRNPRTPPHTQRFEVHESPYLPLPIQRWHEALLATVKNPPEVESARLSKRDGHQLFPNPNLFVTVTSETRRARYFATWKSMRIPCIYRVSSSSSSAIPLSAQQWRDMLFGDFGCRTVDSKAAHNRQVLLEMFGNTLDELKINVDSISASNTTHFPAVPRSKAQATLWELTELNFRFELVALDRRASGSSSGLDDIDRQAIIHRCCSVAHLLDIDVEGARRGLASPEWRERLPCLLAFRALMRRWPGMKPAPLLLSDLESHDMYSELNVQQLEDAVAQFYTQSFFRYFGRPATVPTRLP